jgi:hypothetical protein
MGDSSGERMKCKAMTERLNCGCCDDVRLDCSLQQGHDGIHETTITERNKKYEVRWFEIIEINGN